MKYKYLGLLVAVTLAGWTQLQVQAVAPDSLDFEDFKDAMTLDANTSIAPNGFSLDFTTTHLLFSGGAWTSDGKLGVGDTTPETTFEVAGTASVSGPFTLHGVTYTWPTADGSSGQVLQTDGTGGLSWISLPPASSGTSSNSLDFDEFVDSMNLDANVSLASHGFSYDLLTTNVEWAGTASIGNTLFVQKNNGNVGVATAAPTAQLQVLGNGTGNIFQAVDPVTSQGLRVNSDGHTVIGTTGLNTNIDLNLRHSQNADTGEYIINDDTNGAATALLLVGQEFFGKNYGYFEHLGSGFTTNGLLTADRTLLVGADTQGLALMSLGTSAPMIFATGGFGTANERMRITSAGNVGVATTSPQAKLDINSDSFILETAKTPSSSSATCTVGTHAWDANYVYVCVATNTWKRAALSTW